MGNIDFWYSIGSTYSYLTVMRLPRLAQEYGVNIRWRPFNGTQQGPERYILIGQQV